MGPAGLTVSGRVFMRQVRYSVAMSLDGYIAGPDGEFDWIVMDPDIDFQALMNRFDTIVMGRRTYESTMSIGEGPSMRGMKVVVVSCTLRPADHPDVTIIGDGWEVAVSRLRGESGKDIWLFGGGILFRSMLHARLVDVVEVAVIPVLLGGGRPMLEPPVGPARLKLTGSRVYHKSGIVLLEYGVLTEGS